MKYLTVVLLGGLTVLLLSELWNHIKKERVTLLHRIMIFCLGVYLINVFMITIPPVQGWSISHLGNNISLVPFQVIKTIGENPLDFYGNIIMFIPFGFILVLLSVRCAKIHVTVAAGAILSAGIEFLQLFSFRVTSIDDVILNTFGTFLGFLLGRILLMFLPALRKEVRTYVKSGRIYYKKVNDTSSIVMLTFFTLAFVLGTGFIEYGAALQASDNAITEDKTDEVVMPENMLMPLPEVEAKQVYVLDMEANQVVSEKNGDAKIAPASTTKMLTALTALDYCNPNEVVTIGSEVQMIAEDSSRAWLSAGKQLTVKQLLVALLLPSGNDAAYALAVYAGRIIKNADAISAEQALQVFIDAMNEKAASIGAASSHFTTPDGYDAIDQYTTAQDLALIAKACINNDVLYEIVGCSTISDTWESGEMVTFDNSNELLNPDSEYYYQNVTGLKTGRSSKAGCCLVSSVIIQSKTYICVVMGSSETGRWEDSLHIYEELDTLVQESALSLVKRIVL